MKQEKYIWIVSEYNQYNTPEVLQLLQKANELKKETHSTVWVICIGQSSEEQFDALQNYGATNVLYGALQSFDLETYIYVLEQMIAAFEPELIIFTDKQESKLIAAKLSNRLEVGLTADCIDILVDDKNEYVFLRTAINDTVIANIKCVRSKYQMCTVKSNIFQAKKVEHAEKIEVHRFQDIEEFKNRKNYITIIERTKRYSSNDRDIQKAKVVFAVGRGIRNKETFEIVKKVANHWGAEIVGTRVAVEEGWIDSNRQIGQSGISIAPDLYISFGVSGSIQHMIGLKNTKTIVAINNDSTAPIFNYADYCIVEDLNKILQEMSQYI